MQNTCKKCAQQFEITEQDKKFYEQVKIKSPTLCPDCRVQRRQIFRND
ncbi:zinc-ribbon domain containing protein, partial [Candidatus Peregrinibacteria bacterium]|nr:zinc-ribbon domain containing protein [Candidatus Peregrinibacteria bacterium]